VEKLDGCHVFGEFDVEWPDGPELSGFEAGGALGTEHGASSRAEVDELRRYDPWVRSWAVLPSR
jgi:hypothetical protein